MPNALLLGGPFAGPRPIESPPPSRLELELPEPAAVRTSSVRGGSWSPRLPQRVSYHRVDPDAVGGALVYLAAGYEPTPEDEDDVRESCGVSGWA